MNQMELAGLGDPAESNAQHLPLGTVVGAQRWPYSAAHPGCWQRPWQGVVIALNDPRIWAGNASLQTQEDIDRHVAWCNDQGLLQSDVAVVWDFGKESKVYLESVHRVRPYAEDYLEWHAARAAAFDRELARAPAPVTH